MGAATLPLIFVRGERAVFHVLDPALPAGELPGRLALYFEPPGVSRARLVWNSDDGPRPLDPGRRIGEQVPPEAEVEIRAE
ncbi:MAG TPA: hypothetical protein VG799_03160 [Gemmatimonadota bacterium]|jgi:hypothetical protein|nr:hypothetical protein [Gemmatimonadota bacterium]